MCLTHIFIDFTVLARKVNLVRGRSLWRVLWLCFVVLIWGAFFWKEAVASPDFPQSWFQSRSYLNPEIILRT